MTKMLYRLFSSLLLLMVPAAALADTSVNSMTILRIQQSAPAGEEKKTLAPLTEFLGLDVDKLAGGKLSLHLYGWGQAELGDREGNDYKSDGSLTYGYLQYRFGAANAQARGGRFFVTEGIINEQVDGVYARTDLPYGFGVSAFGGATVHTPSIPSYASDGKGDGIMGGRLNYRYKGLLELGVAGVYESTPKLLTNTFGPHRLVGYDIWLNPHSMVQLTGHTSFNPETDQVAEHSYLLLLRPLKDLSLSASYDEQHDRSYFFSSLLFSNMITNLGQESRSFGGTATYDVKVGEVSADFKHYTRDIGHAERFGGEFRSNTFHESRAGVGYHYLRSSRAFAIVPATGASGSFHEVRGWVMRDTKKYFASADLTAYIFKEDVDNKKSAWEGTGVVGYHISPNLAVSGDLTYGQNPDYNDELKGLLRLTYNMNIKGGSK